MKKLTLALLAPALLATVVACAPQPDTQPEAAAPELVMNLPMTTSSDEATAHFLEGLRASDMGRFVDAQGHFEAAIHADPEFAFAYFGRAVNGNTQEDFANHLKLAADKAAGASEAERLLIESVQKGFDNDLEGQLELTQKLANLAPDSPRAWLAHAQAQAALGRYDDQRATASQVAERWPEFVPAWAQLGNSYLFNEPRDFSKAEEYMLKVAQLEPGEQQSHDFLGDVYRAQGRLIEAGDAYTRAVELAPENGLPLQQRGHVNSFLGNWEQARADYDAAIVLSNPEVRANFGIWRALVSVHEGQPEAAIAELEEMAAAADEMGIAAPLTAKINCLNNIGAIASHTGMFDKAAEAIDQGRTLRMERAAERTDDYRRNQEATVAYQKGMLAARRGDYATAGAKAEEFMQLVEPNTDPRKNDPAHEVMGLAQLLQGNYQEAVEHYEQTNPANIYARYHLGLAHEGAGNAEAAQEIFREVANYNFNFVGYALIREEAIAKVQ